MRTRSSGNEGLEPFNPEIEKRAKFLRKQVRMANNGNQNNPALGGEGVNQPLRIGRPISDYVAPDAAGHGSINVPGVDANNFEIKPAIIQMAASDPFGGSPTEDPNAHIAKFLRICSTFKINGVPGDAIKLCLFPFTVRDKANSWLASYPANYFETWDQLHREFLKRFFPISKTQKMRRSIQNFRQLAGESLAESWERFKEMRIQCPHHGIQNWDLMMAFYEGLLDNSKILVDASSGGSFTILEPDQAEELLEKVAMNGMTWYSERSPQRLIGGVSEVDQISALSAKFDNVATLVQQLAQITIKNQASGYDFKAPTPSRPVLMCELCGGEHNSEECLSVDSQAIMEQVDVVGYGGVQPAYQQRGTYNPNASRNHPGFSWGNPAGAANPQYLNNRSQPPGFQGQQNFRGNHQPQFRQNQGYQVPVNQSKPNVEAPVQSNMELLLEKLVKGQLEVTERLDRMDTRQNMFENQLANQPSISSTKVTGKLPAMPEQPREHMNAVTTRSGKQLLDPPYPNGEHEVRKNLGGENEKVNEGVIAQDKEDEIQEIEPANKHTPPLPFPQKFQKSREEERRANFYSLIKQLDSTIPFIDAVTEIPSYAKFLKEILSNKRRAENRETVAVSEECSALIQNKLPPKLRDPGSFSIPCVIGGSLVQKALCDLGASVSLMPYSLCQKLQLGEPKPTSITLQLADRSVKYPYRNFGGCASED
ncbi:PREDICTED: uncharacterized protein LOC109168278 [Ipomoea nil]|uniref:uncharacterized protein LOC109168278 n=1 Tax=Ipomoea nil TaxID=35883 RepID=UPI000900E1A3|nr:PREDICTED: uncharacterized protein LOC109168278 [Ipomoea nil]